MACTPPSSGPDIQRARRVASQIRAGRVDDQQQTDDPQAPGGFKYSGVGREYGRYGMAAFSKPEPFSSNQSLPRLKN